MNVSCQGVLLQTHSTHAKKKKYVNNFYLFKTCSITLAKFILFLVILILKKVFIFCSVNIRWLKYANFKNSETKLFCNKKKVKILKALNEIHNKALH